MTQLRLLRSLSAADLDVLTRWWGAICAQPEVPPAGTRLVQTRLIRSVAAGELPATGPVFLKWMHFPRRKDRVRYSLRPLPAAHEARLLGVASAAGIVVAEPVAVGVQRSWWSPRRSLLVTRALPAAGSPLLVDDCVEVAAALAAAGVFHPDLNPGNFRPAPSDRGVAVLDFQSARALAAPLGRRLRCRMAAKLWFELAAVAGGQGFERLDTEFRAAAQRAGLLAPEQLDPTWRLAQSQRARFERGRWFRCLRESTQFAVDRGWSAITYRRRRPGAASCPSGWRIGDRALWLGDRWLELTDAGYQPALTAWRRSRPVGWRGSEVLPTVVAERSWAEVERALRAAYDDARAALSRP